VSKSVLIGWINSWAGLAIWAYGYFSIGNPPLVDWKAHTPWWIADCLPNIQSEIGVALMFAGAVLIYWPAKK
jgi:hypothetical protein